MTATASTEDPVTAVYVDTVGKKALVIVRRKKTAHEDGYVNVEWENGDFTSAYFETFRHWGWKRID